MTRWVRNVFLKYAIYFQREDDPLLRLLMNSLYVVSCVFHLSLKGPNLYPGAGGKIDVINYGQLRNAAVGV